MKLVDELEKHKQASKRLSEELEKLKHANDDLPEVILLCTCSCFVK